MSQQAFKFITRVSVLTIAVLGFSSVLAGCVGGSPGSTSPSATSTQEHPDHPTNRHQPEHPSNNEHPEHPSGDHPEHPSNSEHPEHPGS